MAIYTGQETKIQMNNKHVKSKLSQIEQYANTAVIVIFLLQTLFVLVSVVSIYIYGYQDLSKVWYANTYDLEGTDLKTGSVLPLWLEHIFIYYLLYNNCIPISLYVTLEMVNIVQAYLIEVSSCIPL